MPAEDVYNALVHTTHNGFPIITSQNKLVGIVLRQQMVVLFKKKAFCGKHGYPPYADKSVTGVDLDDFATRLQSAPANIRELDVTTVDLHGKYIDMKHFMDPAPFSVMDISPVTRVYNLYRIMVRLHDDLCSPPYCSCDVSAWAFPIQGIRHLPVVNIDNELIGIITRKELLAVGETVILLHPLFIK